MNSSVKLHFAINLVEGEVEEFAVSEGSLHDSKKFSSIIRNNLYVFDLGYWSKELLKAVVDAGAFFLTRVKSKVQLEIVSVVNGVKEKYIGKKLTNIPKRSMTDKIIEVIAAFEIDGKKVQCRAIGFWHPSFKCYRWYMTNLTCSQLFIYDLYRLRWQIELCFKAMKSFLNFDKIPTLSENTVNSFVLIVILNYIFAMIIREEANTLSQNESTKSSVNPKRDASILRAAQGYCRIARIIMEFFKKGKKITNRILLNLNKTIRPILLESFDPNYRKRKTTIVTLENICPCGVI